MKRLEELLIDNLKIYQDDDLYHFTSDSIILSKFAKAKKDDVVADICSGSGIVGIHFYALNKGVIKKATLFEMQESLASLSAESVAYNKLCDVFEVQNMKIQDIPSTFNNKYSVVLCNPPYYKDVRQDFGYDKIKACKNEITVNLEEIIHCSARLLKHGGRLNICHVPDRLASLITTLKRYKLEPKRLTFVQGAGKTYLVLLEAVKGGKEGLKIDFVNN